MHANKQKITQTIPKSFYTQRQRDELKQKHIACDRDNQLPFKSHELIGLRWTTSCRCNCFCVHFSWLYTNNYFALTLISRLSKTIFKCNLMTNTNCRTSRAFFTLNHKFDVARVLIAISSESTYVQIVRPHCMQFTRTNGFNCNSGHNDVFKLWIDVAYC